MCQPAGVNMDNITEQHIDEYASLAPPPARPCPPLAPTQRASDRWRWHTCLAEAAVRQAAGRAPSVITVSGSHGSYYKAVSWARDWHALLLFLRRPRRVFA